VTEDHALETLNDRDYNFERSLEQIRIELETRGENRLKYIRDFKGKKVKETVLCKQNNTTDISDRNIIHISNENNVDYNGSRCMMKSNDDNNNNNHSNNNNNKINHTRRGVSSKLESLQTLDNLPPSRQETFPKESIKTDCPFYDHREQSEEGAVDRSNIVTKTNQSTEEIKEDMNKDTYIRLTEDMNNPMTQGTDIRISEVTDIRISEVTDIRRSEDTDIRISEGTDIRISEGTDIRISEGTDIRKSEGTDIRISESADIRKSDGTDIQISEGEGTDIRISEGTDIQIIESADILIPMGTNTISEAHFVPDNMNGFDTEEVRLEIEDYATTTLLSSISHQINGDQIIVDGIQDTQMLEYGFRNEYWTVREMELFFRAKKRSVEYFTI
jgi:uncharacterized ubiquitin-like protein YukD